MSETLRHQASPAVDYHADFESDDELRIPAFGYPKTNHGWIECVSTSFPSQTYYFNIESGCSTWDRPVSRFIPKRVARPLNLMSDEDFLNDAPLDVSDIEDENEEDYVEEINPDLPPDADDLKPPTVTLNGNKDSRDTKLYAEVLYKLYHCCSCDCNYEIENVAPVKCETFDDDSSENFPSILPETYYSSDSDGKSTISDPGIVRKERKISETSEDDGEREVLHTNNSGTENSENALNISASSVEDSNIGSRDIGLSSDDEEEDEEGANAAKKCLFAQPRLKVIEFADLARPRKSRKRRASNKNDETLKNTPRNKVIKLVSELNGVTTVSYDYLEPELPLGVKKSNLSESESSNCYDDGYSQVNKNTNNNCSNERSAEATKTFDFFNYPLDIIDPDLSDSSTSSASSAGVKITKTKKILKVAKDLKRKESESSESFSSSSSSESSWTNISSSSDDDE